MGRRRADAGKGWRQRQSTGPGSGGRQSDEAVLAYLRAIHAEVKQEYGWPRMHKELLARGVRVGKERVRRLPGSGAARIRG